MNRRWICSDVWMDILPSFDHAQLGLKMALLSDRFDILVDAHFDGKIELTIWRRIIIRKGKGPKAKLSEWIDGKFVDFPFPDRPLPNKIRFKNLRIDYIDHSVLAFIRSNKQIWDRNGTKFELDVPLYANDKHKEHIWDVLAREIWPIFAQNLRNLSFTSGDALDNLRRRTSPTIFTDLDQLNSISTYFLCPDGIADDGPNSTSGQALSKWLHTPSKNGQPRQLYRNGYVGPLNLGWVNSFKEAFRRATTSVTYTIQLYFHVGPTPNEQFELVNKRTKEKLTLKHNIDAPNDLMYNWLLQRCPIEETAPIKWENRENSDANFNYIRYELRYDYSGANLNNIRFELWGGNRCIGPLSPPAEEEKEEKADQSNENIV